MEWYQVLTIVGANLGLFLWAVRQSRTDFLHTCRIIESIQSEMKNFHGRLCSLEERLKDKQPKSDPSVTSGATPFIQVK